MRDSKNSFFQTRSVKKFSQEKKFGSGHREWAGFMLPWRNISLCQKFQKICKENWGRLFIDLQRDGHNKFISKWFTDASISKIGMLTHIWRRITAIFNLSISAPYSPLHHSNSWKFHSYFLPIVFSFHPTFKLLYSYLALTDLLIGVVIHRLCAIYRMSMVHEHWSLCWYVLGLSYVAAFALCGVPLLTMTVISLNRLLALLLGLRYKQTLTLKRTYITVVAFWIESFIAVFTFILDPQTTMLMSQIVILSCPAISSASYTKIFQALRLQRA